MRWEGGSQAAEGAGPEAAAVVAAEGLLAPARERDKSHV